MRSAIMVAALVALAGGLAACDSSESPASSGPTQAGGTSVRQSGAPGDEPTVVPGLDTTDPTPAPGPSPTGLPSRDDATVDARDYQQRDSFYFQSPTGNIMCGIVSATTLGVGCQLGHANVIPPQLPDCTDAPDRKVAVHVYGGKAEFLCTSQGIFVGEPVDGTRKGGGKILNYGDTIIALGAACTSTPQGMRCDAGGHGFLISADSQTIF
ncbi:DUF6636 domain-containing protein [Nocardia sp. NPDC058519]|uniref:DUF6636 domain-containing protein n=1 Tax=Nocardia sp. NPDC058519 TaxID=3346535 RepID=UPI00364C0EA9